MHLRIDRNDAAGGRRRARALLATVALAIGALAVPAGAEVPPGAQPVGVQSGAVTHVDATLTTLPKGASISGQVTAAADGAPLSGFVKAYLDGTPVGVTQTAPDGSYTIDGLAPSADGYAVCVASGYVYGPAEQWYVGNCFGTSEWDGGSVPAGATRIALSGAEQRAGVDITLLTAGAISGNVTAPGGTPISSVRVLAYNRGSGVVFGGHTDNDGHYFINRLPAAAAGYTVCFDPKPVRYLGTGFRPKCFVNAGWNGTRPFPSAATKVDVALGHTTIAVNDTLAAGGAISGKVTDVSGHGLAGFVVDVYGSGGMLLGSGTSANSGHYFVKGLPSAHHDHVCARSREVSASTTYHGECWSDVSWNGGAVPSGARAVSVTRGHTTTPIRFSLGRTVVRLGSIAGRVTDFASGTPAAGVLVDLFTGAGAPVESAYTDQTGAYALRHVKPSSGGYVVCVELDPLGETPYDNAPPTLWAPRCYHDVAWNGLRSSVPAAAARLPLGPGQTRTGIDIRLHAGGEIVADVAHADMYVFDTAGRLIDFGDTDIKGLTPGSYVVCFDGRAAGYLSECYDNVPWDGVG